jgi:C4-dicarboxylate-specific signal transduction histidine kinase
MTDDVDNEATRTTLDDGLAFFGAVTASVSHELNNVISIIDQTAGLVQDMIAAENKGIPINIDRLSTAVGTIQTQTERGIGIIGRLNRFAHSADEAHVEFDVADVLGNLVELCQRLAGLKYTRLELARPAERLKMVGSPFFLQAAVFLSIRTALGAVERNDTIHVSARAEGDGALVQLESPRDIDTDHRDMVVLRFITQYMNARVEVRNEEHQTVVEMTFPGGGRNASSG